MRRRFLILAPALVLLGYGLWIGPRYDRFVLPAFDGFVYDAMADHPRVFTLAPWGYRILGPTIVHLLPVSSAAVGYFWLNLGFLTASVFIIGLWLRRLGFSTGSAALASLAFVASPPVAEFLNYQVLVSPLGVFILSLMLLELTAPRTLVMAALFAAGVLTREECLIPLALLFVGITAKEGWRQGARTTLIAGAPALVLAMGLRATWGEARAEIPASLVGTLVHRMAESGSDFVATAALGGVGLLGLVGLARETSVPLRIQSVLLWFLTLIAVLVNPYHFSAPDLPRLSAFAWPGVLPLALAGLGFKRADECARPARIQPWSTLASIATLLSCAILVLTTDPYRRAPTETPVDPIPFLARNRETLKTARALNDGETFVFDARAGRFASPVTERFNLTEGRNHRWFLYRGFGPDAAFARGLPEFRRSAELLLPVLNPRDTDLRMELESTDSGEVRVEVAGRPVATVPVNAGAISITVPGSSLFRGDNKVRLSGRDGAVVRLVRLEVSMDPPAPGKD